MKKNFTLLAILLMCIPVLGQFTTNWMRAFGGAPNTSVYIKKSLIDSNDNIYTMGIFSFYSNFMDNSTTNAVMINGTHSFVAKYDSLGQLLWINNNSGTLHDMAFDSNENIVATGNFTGTNNFNDGAVINGTIPTEPQVFTLKLNKSNGNFLWKSTLPNGINEYKPLNALRLTVLTDNSVVIGTNYIGSYSSPRLQLVKLNPNGDVTAVKPYYDPSNNGYDFMSIKSDNNNNIYVGGSFYFGLNVDLNGGTHNLTDPSNTNSLTAFVAKYDSNFNHLWSKSIGGNGNAAGSTASQVINMEVDKATQKSYVSFFVGGNCDLNNGSSPSIMTNFWQSQLGGAVLAVYDGSGQLQNHHLYTGAGFNVGDGYLSHIQLKGNRIVLSGNVNGNPDIDISSNQVFAPSPPVNTKMSNFVSVFTINSDNSFTLDSNQYFLVDLNQPKASVIGMINGDFSKVILAGGAKSLIPYQSTEMFPSYINHSFLMSTNSQMLNTVEIKDIKKKSIIIATDDGDSMLRIISKDGIEDVRIYSMDGKQIHQSSASEIDLITFPKGTYIAQIKTSKGIVAEKFIKRF